VFHYSDLVEQAKAAVWVAPPNAAASALTKRVRRRKLATKPDDAPFLSLPDRKHLGPLVNALEAASVETPVGATLMAACLEEPVLAYASPQLSGSRRAWRRMAMLSDISKAALLTIAGVPGRKGVRIESVDLQVVDLSDATAVRDMIELTYAHGDRPQRDVRDRGRKTAPRAVLLGTPQPPSESFTRRAGAIAAVDGYRLEVVQDVSSRVRTVLHETADFAPELVLLCGSQVPPGDFARRIRSVVAGATIGLIDEDEPEAVLSEIRAWTIRCSVTPIKATAKHGPATLHGAALLAQEQCTHLKITDQAIKRAAKSPYEDPAAVLEALLTLDAIAGDYTADGLGSGGFAQACAERRLLYSRDISPTALQKHRAEYRVEWGEAHVTMGPHLRFGGSWNPRQCARVYWHLDTKERKVVIGHIGVHLPGGDE
jgi:hypothetical protein